MTYSRRLCRLLALVLALFIGFGTLGKSARAANVSVTADYAQSINTVGGFGASFPWIAHTLETFTPENQVKILDALFATDKPSAGLSYIRINTFLNHYNPSPGVYDWTHWSIAGQMDVVKRAQAGYGVDRIIASNWTPPAYMKDSNSANGGRLMPAYYPDAAAVMVRWLDQVRAEIGVDVDILSVQNEPDLSTGYESCEYSPAEMISFTVNYLKPTMGTRPTRLMAGEPSVYGGAGFFDSRWGFPLLDDPAMRAAIDIMATHGYASTSDLGDPSNACLQYNKPIWMTEDMENRGRYTATMQDGQGWATEIYRGLNLGNFSGWFHWWAYDGTNNNGHLIHTPNFTVDIPKRVYTIGHFSRFLRPGSVVVRSTSSSSDVEATAAIPTTGKVVIVLSNKGKSTHTITVNLSHLSDLPTSVIPYRTSSSENQVQLSPVSVSGGAFTITVPKGSMVTVVGQ